MTPDELSVTPGSVPSARSVPPVDGAAGGHPNGPTSTARVGASLTPEAVEALGRLVDALATDERDGADVAPTDPPVSELDELVRQLHGDQPLQPLALLAHRAVALRLERDNLRVALETNRTISAAVGILMALRHLVYDDAFDLLVTVSQNHNRKLRDVAEAVIRTGLLPGDDVG